MFKIKIYQKHNYVSLLYPTHSCTCICLGEGLKMIFDAFSKNKVESVTCTCTSRVFDILNHGPNWLNIG